MDFSKFGVGVLRKFLQQKSPIKYNFLGGAGHILTQRFLKYFDFRREKEKRKEQRKKRKKKKKKKKEKEKKKKKKERKKEREREKK